MPPKHQKNISVTEKSRLGLYKLITIRKPFIFLALAAGVLFLSTTLSPEAGKVLSDEDGLIENITTFILFATAVLGIFSMPKQNQNRRSIAIISFVSLLAFLSELSFGERIFNLDMPHAGGKQLDGIHDLLHMLQKIFIANYNYQPAETTVAATALTSLLVLATYAARKKIGRLNIYLKGLGVRYLMILAIIFGIIAQGLDLNLFLYKNHRILEETLELLSAICLFATILKIKSLNYLRTSQ